MKKQTVRDLLVAAEAGLNSHMEAKWLVASAVNVKPNKLYEILKRPINDLEKKRFDEFFNKRKSGEPLQLVLGNWDFIDIKVKIEKNVFIPRFETELVAYLAKKSIEKKKSPSVLEIGTGTGVIAIYLAKALSTVNVKVIATDVDEKAINLAKKNAELNNVTNSIQFIKSNLFEKLTDKKSFFNLIVSNPPYVSEEEYSFLSEEIKQFEPKHALVPEGSPMYFYEKILSNAKSLLKPNGVVVLELSEYRASQVLEFANLTGLYAVLVHDFAQKPRVLISCLKDADPTTLSIVSNLQTLKAFHGT